MFKISTRSYMVWCLRGAIFRKPKVILPKVCVCYVVCAEYVTVGSGYRLVLSVEASVKVVSGYRLVLSVEGSVKVGSGYQLVLSVEGSVKVGSEYRLVLSVEASVKVVNTVWCFQSKLL
jgi:hypothetical protein